MSQKTPIEWTDRSSNPIRARRKDNGKRGHACIVHDPSCINCYSQALNVWRGTGFKFDVPNLAKVDIILDEKELDKLRRLRGGKVFICDMTDLFGHWVPDSYLDAVFDALESNPRITPQILTKRTRRMQEYLSLRWGGSPPTHIWVGTSVGVVQAIPRIDLLKLTPAAVRFISFEPLIENLGTLNLQGIHWAIVGGESGHSRSVRPMHPDWARQIRDDCRQAGAAFFFKQFGAWMPITWREAFDGKGAKKRSLTVGREGDSVYTQVGHLAGFRLPGEVCMIKVGKKAAGRVLDGQTWDEMPEVAPCVS
jgi:protein gp37